MTLRDRIKLANSYLSKWTVEQPSGFTPNCSKGVKNVALSLAIVTSHRAGAVTPPPIPGPLTAAMIGLGNWMKTLNIFSFSSCISLWTPLGDLAPATISAKLPPEQK